MAQARTRSLHLVEPEQEPLPGPIEVDIGSGPSATSLQDGALKTENPDGSLTIDLAPDLAQSREQGGFYENLASQIADDELARIASDLLEGIDNDERSRSEWMETRAKGIKLLGLKIEEPGGDVASSSAPLDGMSRIRHPLLLESTLRFQANAGGELLPASGPVKVRNDTPAKPLMGPGEGMPPMMGHNGGPPLEGMPTPPPPMAAPAPMAPPMAGPPGAGMPPPMNGRAPGAPPMGMPPPMPKPPAPLQGEYGETEELASALETDMNHYLTVVAPEYYPDTDRMLFYVGFGGQGFKKVYNCPIRQRPVSESVDAEDLIVSNSATSLDNCGRITHKIKMRPSVLKRMQLLGVYRNVHIGAASQFQMPNVVEKAKQETEGVNPSIQKPQEADHVIYEAYCELDIAGFEHKKNGKPTGLQCPYKVSIHKDTRQILEIRRNWEEGDDLCMPKAYFVEFPFVRGLGFYGIGLVHIAGNTTNTLTAAWRELLDAGMFASFPGFIYAKQVGRQLTNQFRVPPGGGIGLEVGTQRLQDAVMPLPYKEPGPAFTSFITHVEQVGQRVSGTAEVNIGEGKQEVPVGTTLAMIEQATKVMDAVHKRLHAAQAKEFQLLKERFREDPEAFWRHNKKPAMQWRKDQFLSALDKNELVPVADPNNPTSLHRIAKALAIKTLQQSNPSLYNGKNVDTRIMRIVGIDPEGLFADQQAASPPDPKVMAVMMKSESDKRLADMKAVEMQLKQAMQVASLRDREEDRESREKIEQMKLDIEKLQVLQAEIIHIRDLQAQEHWNALDFEKQKELKKIEMEAKIIMERHKASAKKKASNEYADGGAVWPEEPSREDKLAAALERMLTLQTLPRRAVRSSDGSLRVEIDQSALKKN